MNVDVIIVGQGLAGSTLALELKRRGVTFFMIDKGIEKSSTIVAAGLYNPVAYKRMLPSWNSSELLLKMKAFFLYVENVLNEKFLFSKNSLKIFSSVHDRDLLSERPADDRLNQFTNAEIKDELEGFNTPFGYMEFNDTGYLNTRRFLEATRSYLKNLNLLKEEVFDESELIVGETSVQYKELKASRIVYCTGSTRIGEIWRYLPFRPVKGELMVIEMDSDVDEIIVKDGFILPLGNKRFVMGSTYEWNDLTDRITDEGLKALEVKLEKMTSLPYKVLERKAGVRPASHDRRPFVGWHPNQKNIGILNGLGSKGVLYAPFCAFALAENLQFNTPLPNEIDIKRVKLS